MGRFTKCLSNHLLQGVDTLETLVLPDEHLRLFVVKPIALAFYHLLAQLRIELTMVDGVAEVDVARYLYTDETAAACGVCQWLGLVGGSDERGIAAILSDGFAVGGTELDVGGGQQILQQHLLALGGLVELVDIDQCERCQAQAQVGLILERDAVVIVVAQLTGQQYAAEAGLATALATY